MKKINYTEIANILSEATWDYNYNMQRIDESVMDDYTGQLGNTTFTEKDVIDALGKDGENEILKEYVEDEDLDINEFAARYIADSVAQSKVDCIYETVTFKLEFPFEEALQRFTNVNTKDLTDTPNVVEEVDPNKATPFLKWVGGKRSIIGELKSRLPQKYNSYYEAFVGGGALFFELTPKKSFLSDANLDLIITYKVIQKDVEALITRLKEHQKKHNADYYYKVRGRHDLNDAIEIAARMIYLNKTCYNGLWRVNKKGEFNVPVGSYTNPAIVSEENLRACNKALKNAVIEYKDYSKIEPKAGDFCYFDPPYHPTSDTSFTKYSKLDFTEKDQADLRDFCTELHKAGVHVMISNSNTKFIRDLYNARHFKIAIVNAPRFVNCKPNGRNAVEEVLISIYL